MSSNFKGSELKHTLLMLSGSTSVDSTLGLQNMEIVFSFKTISALKSLIIAFFIFLNTTSYLPLMPIKLFKPLLHELKEEKNFSMWEIKHPTNFGQATEQNLQNYLKLLILNYKFCRLQLHLLLF